MVQMCDQLTDLNDTVRDSPGILFTRLFSGTKKLNENMKLIIYQWLERVDVSQLLLW